MNVDPGALERLGVELVLLFGSQARGTARPPSDVDVGVLFAGGVDADFGRREDVRRALGADDEVDIAILNEAAPLLLREVAIDGQVLYEARPGAVEEFRLRAHKLYMDTAWMREVQADVLRRRYG